MPDPTSYPFPPLFHALGSKQKWDSLYFPFWVCWMLCLYLHSLYAFSKFPYHFLSAHIWFLSFTKPNTLLGGPEGTPLKLSDPAFLQHYDLTSASWRIRRNSGVIQSKFKAWGSQRIYGENPSQYLEAWKPGLVVSGQERWMFRPQEKRQFSLAWPFCSIQALNKLNGAHLHWWGDFFMHSIDLNANLF